MMLLADIEHRELEEVAGARTLHQACGEVRVALADWHDRFPKEVANADQ